MAVLIMAASFVTSSCDILKEDNSMGGKSGEVLIVLDSEDRDSDLGVILRDSLTTEYPFLPQIEPRFELSFVSNKGFDGLYKTYRNIIVPRIDPSRPYEEIEFKESVWCNGQFVIYIHARNMTNAAKLAKENMSSIIKELHNAERKRIIKNAKKFEDPAIGDAVRKVFGGSPHFPEGYNLKSKTENFIWVANDTESKYLDVLIYKYPVVEGEDMMSAHSLVTNMLDVLRENVPGRAINNAPSYMTIAETVRPQLKYILYNGRYTAELRGLWELKNGYMGGPFVSHMFYSDDKKYIIGVIGFVYAPKYEKRESMKHVEGIVYSYE